MIDARLTKLTGALLVAMRDQIDHLLASGLVDREQLRLGIRMTMTPALRKSTVAKLREAGLSQRQIAAVVGVDQKTICNDLREEDSSKRKGGAP
jgi:predicted XRE-type DNA-binding protein